MSKIGLKTISERLLVIEGQSDSSLNGKMNKIKNDLETKIISQSIEHTFLHFTQGLDKNKIDVSIKNLPKIIEYAVKFVEQFFNTIVTNLNVHIYKKEQSGVFKLQTCITFIKEILDLSIFDDNLFINMINEIVDLLFNRKKLEEKETEEKLRRKGKKNGSLRKISKILTCQK